MVPVLSFSHYVPQNWLHFPGGYATCVPGPRQRKIPEAGAGQARPRGREMGGEDAQENVGGGEGRAAVHGVGAGEVPEPERPGVRTIPPDPAEVPRRRFRADGPG